MTTRTKAGRALLVTILPTVTLTWWLFSGESHAATSTMARLLGASAFFSAAALSWYFHSLLELENFSKFEMDVRNASGSTQSIDLERKLRGLERRAEERPHLRAAWKELSPSLMKLRTQLLDEEVTRERRARVTALCAAADAQVRAALKRKHEVNLEVQARAQLEEAIPHLRHLVAEADQQFEDAMSGKVLTWWNRLTRDRSPLDEVESQADALEVALAKLRRSPSLLAADEDYKRFESLLDQRIAIAREAALRAIPASHTDQFDGDKAIAVGFLATAASIPVSAALDLHSAANVYNSLREVNSNFADMSDFEIWQETLVMPAESLVGLASLTKGAYFEKIVESEFGGERFATFNHPDTDIMIDGVAYQIKATDSVGYVESVADHIPVIATSEVAEKTGVIDGAMTDLQLTETIDLALGGTAIDVGDTILDGATTGLGAVGVVAILRGAHSAWISYSNGESALNSLGVGLKTTGVSTARSAVNLAELAFLGTKAATTLTARIVSRKPSD
jgi:hypothetical protein